MCIIKIIQDHSTVIGYYLALSSDLVTQLTEADLASHLALVWGCSSGPLTLDYAILCLVQQCASVCAPFEIYESYAEISAPVYVLQLQVHMLK